MTTRRLFVALFAIALFTMAVREALDPDMWWHLRTGEYISENGVPRQDVFSYTVPDHEWITHEWLSQRFMWLVYTLGEFPGLIIVFAGLTAASYWLVYSCSAGRPYLAGFVTLLAAIASAIVWGVRPQIFNLLLTAAFVHIIERYRKEDVGWRGLWLLPVLTVLWVNLHSGYLLGIVLAGVYIVGEAVQRWRQDFSDWNRTLEWPKIRRLAGMAAASFLLAAINPNGPQIWVYPFETLGSPAMQAYIQEWHSPDFHQVYFWPFGLMLAVGVASLLFSGRRPLWSELLLCAGAAAASLLSSRNIPLFAIVATPVISRHLWHGFRRTRFYRSSAVSELTASPDKRLIVLNWAILAMALLMAIAWAAAKISGNQAAVAGRYPVAAVDYLERSGLADARGYNSYNWGGYLIWRGLPVFVDGRADVYGDEFLAYYRLALDITHEWRRPLDDYQVAYVLMERGSGLAVLLDASQGWEQVYVDELAEIYTRAP